MQHTSSPTHDGLDEELIKFNADTSVLGAGSWKMAALMP